eukprot:312481_1
MSNLLYSRLDSMIDMMDKPDKYISDTIKPIVCNNDECFGTYKWTINNISKVIRSNYYQSDPFAMCGTEWKIQLAVNPNQKLFSIHLQLISLPTQWTHIFTAAKIQCLKHSFQNCTMLQHHDMIG